MDRTWRRPGNGSNNPATPYGQRLCKSAPCSPAKAMVKNANNGPSRADSFHVVHKVPAGDSPYVKAKHVQLVDKEPDRAVALFWAAINAGDRVDSALKDMAIVMKQQNRPEEAIEAIKSLRNRCSDQAQESLDNVLLDLYKRCGRLDDQIALLKHKLNLIHQGLAFNGKRTKTARSQGKKFQVSIEQEATRLLGNLGWAYMQQSNYIAAEAVYRKALSIELDNNKMCNLGICLMHQGRVVEAKAMLQNVKPASANGPWGLDSHLKSYERAQEMLRELEVSAIESLKSSVWQSLPCPWKHTENHQNEDEKQNLVSVDSDATTLLATSGFGPSQQNSVVSSDRDSQFSMFSNDFIEEDGGFVDENVNINTSINVPDSLQSRASYGLPQDTEVLRQKIDKICLKENGNAKGSPFCTLSSSCRDQSGLNSAAPPFFSKQTNQRNQQSGLITSFEKRSLLPCKRTNENPRMPFEEKKRVLVSAANGLPTANTKRPTNQIPTIPKVFIGQSLEKETRSSFLDQSFQNETGPSFLGQSLQTEAGPSFLCQSFQNETGPSFLGQSLQTEAGPSFLCQSLQNERRPYFGGQSLQNEARSFFLGHSLKSETKPSFLGQSLRNETRPATRRSLSFESIGVELDLPPLPTKAMAMTSSNTVPFLMQDNNAVDPWDTLGFIEAPDSKDFEQVTVPDMSNTAEVSPAADSNDFEKVTMPALSKAPNAAEVSPAPQRKCHGRLRVFQEMTLPPSPKA